MAATKRETSKKKLIDEDQIIALYMDYMLKTEHGSPNVYRFCKENEIEESDFYSFFGSFDSIKQIIWLKFFENATSNIEKEEAYSTYSDKNKLLTLFFTMFEILTLNRSYVTFTLKENHQGLKNLKDLKQFRRRFKNFIEEIIDDNEANQIAQINKITKPLFAEGAWIQFLLLLKFWLEDGSKGFEKTDIAIEKSVNTVVDLLNTRPLINLIDLGKFLWKERKM
ncbi:MAG: TetR/AcrR family transcriptional regulator [Burkholderiales bacterium]|nr:TetR/AcrR family transcriptional regulator [Flavobacterium sp.]